MSFAIVTACSASLMTSVKPGIVVSASVIPWGAPPTGEAAFEDAAPMQRVFQDWRSWLEEGILDLAVPMNYARESDARVRGWFDGWIGWESRNQNGRAIAVGLGGYRNTPDDTLAQVARVRSYAGRDRLAGVSLFSYRVPAAGPGGSEAVSAAIPGERLLFLSAGTADSPPAFAALALLPSFPWIERPTTGMLGGLAASPDGGEADDVEVEVRRTGLVRKTRRVRTDANGFFGLARLSPGRYRVRLATDHETAVVVSVEPGKLARADVSARAR